MGHLDGQGRLCLAGRQNRMLVTAGRNLFPEEVEACLAACPGVAAASVQGQPDALRGMAVLAWVQPETGAAGKALTPTALAAWCRERLEAFKVPRRFLLSHDWPLTPGGKTDHPALARRQATLDA